MTTRLLSLLAILAASTLAAAPLAAQDTSHTGHTTASPALDSAAATAARIGSAEVQQGTAAPAGHGDAACAHDPNDIITPHITDSRCIEVPSFPKFWAPPHAIALPQWAPIHIGGVAIDLSPTKHVVMLLLAAVLCCLLLIGAARAHKRHTHAVGRPKGFAAGLEALVLYLREEVVMKNIPHGGARYAPFILGLFFFILVANLLGLIPFGSTATGNISVTATLAIITFVVVEIACMRAQGLGYLNTIFYWTKELPLAMRIPMFLLMSPIELVGKLTKPFALAIRLFANMTAGHIVVLALIGLILLFRGVASGAPLLAAIAIMMLELFVAFLQAFIFALLSSVFIGQIREAHH